MAYCRAERPVSTCENRSADLGFRGSGFRGLGVRVYKGLGFRGLGFRV